MDLTEANKAYIDGLSHYDLLSKIRFAPSGDPWMQGETGNYWIKKCGEKQAEDPRGAVADSKALGW